MKLTALEKIPDALEQADAAAGGIVWLEPFAPGDDSADHELVFFIKPELLLRDADIKLAAVLEFLDERLAAYDIRLGSLAALAAKYLETHGIMQAHYGVINKVSREGADAISDDAQKKLRAAFGARLESGVPTLGGHQILERFSDLTPASLNALWEHTPSTKLAGGTYAVEIDVRGEPIVALNGFHPDQIEHFVGPGRRIVVATVRTRRTWAALRGDLIGATNPAKAAPGSIRASLLARRAEFGLGEVNQGFNGVHLSAGPLEGLVELVRFASDRAAGTSLSPQETCFGRLLAAAGFSAQRVQALMANPDLNVDGQQISAFDLTEEMDAAEAVQALNAVE